MNTSPATRRSRPARAVFATLLMLAPSLAVVLSATAPVATAADIVPFADGVVPWQAVSGLRTLFYFTTPSASEGGAGGLTTSPPANGPGGAPSGESRPYGVVSGDDIPLGNQVATMIGPRFLHEVNITGDNALTVVFEADVPPGAEYTWTVAVRSDGSRNENVGTETWTMGAANDRCDTNVLPTRIKCIVPVKIDPAHRRHYPFREGSSVRVDISAAGSDSEIPLSTNAWSLRYRDPARPSYIEFRSDNIVKAATWTADKDSIVTEVFRPTYKDKDGKPVKTFVDAFFAVKSALNANELCGGLPDGGVFPDDCLARAETRVVYRVNGTEFPVGPSNLTHIDLDPDANSTESQGIMTWRFPEYLWDIGRFPFPTGEFSLSSTVPYRTNDPAQTDEIEAKWDFVISTQALTLRPYDDTDASTQPTPLESQAHEIAPGGSTTFLILAGNGGRLHDNLSIDVQLVNAQPAFGWQHRVRGEKLSGLNVLAVPPESEGLFLLTVTAPATAVPGQSAVYTVQTRSTVDPQAKSTLYTVIATVSDNVREDAGVVVLDPNQRVRPGLDNDFVAYIWNRGTRPADLTMTLRELTTEGWNASLVGSADRYRFTATSVPAGDLYPVTVRIRPDPQLSVGTDKNVTLNVTRAAGGGLGGQAEMFFRLSSFTSFRVELLRGINGADRHYLEMWCPAPGDSTAPTYAAYCAQARNVNDTVDGTYFRAWITNTGDVSSRYSWSIDDRLESYVGSTGGPSDLRDNASFAAPQIGFRDPKGRFTTATGIELLPGQTAEVYIWVPHQGDASTFMENTLGFEFVVRNVDTRQELRRLARAAGFDSHNNDDIGPGADFNDGGFYKAVKLEAVERLRDYFTSGGSKPIVDVTNANKGFIEKFVDLSGVPQIFHVRLTHGGSYKNHVDEDDRFVSSDIGVVIKGAAAAREQGWNVSMRPRTGETDEKKNPWKESLSLTNQNEQNGNRWESFRDYEIEVQVRPPINGTARVAAGETRTFLLEAGSEAFGNARMELTAIVSKLANVTLSTAKDQEVVHAGQQAAFALLLSNNGSAEAPLVSLKARVADANSDPNLWTLTPKEQNLNLAAHENRTIALLVGAPPTAVPGDVAVVNVSLEYAKVPDNPNSEKVTRYLELSLQVRPPSKLQVTPLPASVQSAPEGLANFTLELRNLDNSKRTSYRVEVSPLPNWTQSYPTGGVVEAGATTRFAYLLRLPIDVIRDRSYASVVKVVDTSDPDNFDVAVVQVNIIGGQPFPTVTPAKGEELVNRDGTVKFLMGVKNLGSAPGTFPLEAKTADTRWSAHVENEAGAIIKDVTVSPNENVNVYLVVRAPRQVQEGAVVLSTLTAFSPNFDRNSASTVRAVIHDYGLDVEVRPARADLIAGQSAEFVVKVTNLGNGNDTLNLSADLQGLSDWAAEFSTEQVTLNPGTSTDVNLVVRSPKERLPVARSYTMSVFGGSVGGAGLGLPKNDSAAIVLAVLNYRAFDVDSDGFLELAVDKNKRTADGYEHYLEIFTQGQVTQVVDNLSGKDDGKLDFLLDVPEDGSYDGVADLYYDPQEPFVYVIEFTPDLNGDATPDYLIDTDNDGVIDHAWDTATRTLWAVTVIRAFGGTAEQYLVDLNNDGNPDRYFDPAKNLVTKTVPQDDGRVGILTDADDRNPSKYYDTNSGEVSDARVSSLGGFAQDYWYFFLGFLLVLVVFAAVLVRRRGSKGEE